jgi:hypothetical protein
LVHEHEIFAFALHHIDAEVVSYCHLIFHLTLFAIALVVFGAALFTEILKALYALSDSAVCVVAYRTVCRDDSVDESQFLLALIACGFVLLPVFLLALLPAIGDAAAAAAAHELFGLLVTCALAVWVAAFL